MGVAFDTTVQPAKVKQLVEAYGKATDSTEKVRVADELVREFRFSTTPDNAVPADRVYDALTGTVINLVSLLAKKRATQFVVSEGSDVTPSPHSPVVYKGPDEDLDNALRALRKSQSGWVAADETVIQRLYRQVEEAPVVVNIDSKGSVAIPSIIGLAVGFFMGKQ